MDASQILTFLAAGLGGGGLLKLVQVWLAHQRAVGGEFSARTTAARDNFQLVVSHLENRIEHLEASEKQCRERNEVLEKNVRKLEARIEELILRSPWREISDICSAT